MCVALTLWVFAATYGVFSTSAAEDGLHSVEKVGANPIASEKLLIANPAAAKSAAATNLDASVAANSVAEAKDIVPPVAIERASGDTVLPNIEPAAGSYEFPEDTQYYDLILRVQRKSDTLAPAIMALQKNFDYLIPVLEIARLVKFPVETDLSRGYVSGSFINPQNTFSLDAENRIFTVNGVTTEIPEGQVVVKDLAGGLGDIYVSAEIMNTLWPLDININFAELILEINTRQKLAYELERDRKKRQDALLEAENENIIPPNYQYVPNDYKLLSPHVFNVDETLTRSSIEHNLQNNLSVSGQGDFLGTTANYTANLFTDSKDTVDLQNMRLTLTREDFGQGTLPFGLKMAQVGDVSAKPSPLIEKLMSGRGVFITSDERAKSQGFDEVTIQGTALPGWEVEVYRGAELLNFGTVNERGEYIFENVPLNYGNNPIRIVLYGPQGQIEERTEDYSIGYEMLKPGKTNFTASILDYQRDLINLEDDSERQGLGETVRVNHGLTSWLTGFVTGTKTQTFEGPKNYVTVGGNLTALGGKGLVELYKQSDGGHLLDTRFGRTFAGINTTLRGSFYKDFESRDSGFNDFTKTFEGEFKLAKSFNLPIGQLSLDLSALYTKRKDDRTDTQLRSSQSLVLDRIQFSNILNTTLLNQQQQQTTGTLSANTRLGSGWSLRSSLDYDLYPDAGLDLSRTELRYTAPNSFTSNVFVNQGIRDTDSSAIGVGAGYDFKSFLGSADASWSRSSGVDIMLRANTTFGPEGEDKKYGFSSDYKGYNTALKVRLFKDNDSDGAFSPGDEPIPEGRVRIGERISTPADENGIIDLLGAGPPGFADVTVDQTSLSNKFLASKKEGYRTVLRNGSKPFIDFALVETGTIDGTVRLGNGTPVPGLKLQLFDPIMPGGTLFKETTTSYDGYYVFEFVRPGTYLLQVDPSLQVNVPPMTVSVTSDELFATGKDLNLLEQAAEVSTAEEADGGSGRVAQLHHAPAVEGTLQPAPISSGGGVQSVVRSVRFGGTPDKVRLVLDLSGQSDYHINTEADGRAVTIDLPNSGWEGAQSCTPPAKSFFTSCEVMASPNGGTRLRLNASDKILIFYNGLLPAEAGKGPRVYVDFMRANNP